MKQIQVDDLTYKMIEELSRKNGNKKPNVYVEELIQKNYNGRKK